MRDPWQYQVRIDLADAAAMIARRDPADPALAPLPEILERHRATMTSQYDAFAGYVAEAEHHGIEKYPLYKWTKATIENPAKKEKYQKSFTLYVDGDEVYAKAKADALESDLQPLVGGKLVTRSTTPILPTTRSRRHVIANRHQQGWHLRRAAGNAGRSLPALMSEPDLARAGWPWLGDSHGIFGQAERIVAHRSKPADSAGAGAQARTRAACSKATGAAGADRPIPCEAQAFRPRTREVTQMSKSASLIAGGILLGVILGGGAAAEPLKVAHSTWVGYGPLYVAKEKGFFDEEGVEVELIVMEDPKLRFPALAAGQIDVAVSTVDTVLNYLSDQQGYRYLFAIDDSKGGDGIVADQEIQSVADLKGKAVAYAEGSVSQFYLGVLLKEAGLSLKDVETMNMTAGDAGAAFVAERVDAAVTWEPWLTRGKQSPHGHLLVDSSTSPGLITDVALTTPEKLDARAEDMKALYRAWVKAVEFQKANGKEADEIMARGVGGWLEDPAVFAETRAGIAYYDDAMNRAFIGTPDAPGGIATTIVNAEELGREIGQFEHDVAPADLIAFEIVNQ